MSNNEYIGTSEAARILGCCEQTVMNWLRSGKLRPAIVTSRGWRLYLRSEIESISQTRTKRPSEDLQIKEGSDASDNAPTYGVAS